MRSLPNLVFLMPDQQRHDFIGCYGADFVRTPNIDRLAKDGVRYARAYSQSPLCVPARASLLTGRSALGNGVTSNGEWLRPDLAACGITTWPEALATAGYDTASIGKMHFYPWDASFGFRHRSICEDKRWVKIRDDYFDYLEKHGMRKYAGSEHPGYLETKGAILTPNPGEHSWDRFVGREACRYLKQERATGRPFAMMVGFPSPHCPYDADSERIGDVNESRIPKPVTSVPGDLSVWKAKNIAAHRRSWDGIDYADVTLAQRQRVRAHYVALVETIDEEIGKIIATLEEIGELENTVIIYSSDHGDSLGDHALNGKGTFYESSTHIPLIVRPAGGARGVVNEGLVELTDITSTMLTYAGVALPRSMNHSRCLPGLGFNTAARNELFGCLGSGWMAIKGEWKLIKPEGDHPLLFNLRLDPKEQHNLFNHPDCLEIQAELDQALTAWVMKSLRDGHEDKRMDPSWEDLDFAARGWKRPYPHTFTTA